MQRLVTCVEELNRWMGTDRLKLNMDKTQFIWLGTPHQLPRVSCWKLQLGNVEIEISNEAGVSLVSSRLDLIFDVYQVNVSTI
jgi:hypothetical protein